MVVHVAAFRYFASRAVEQQADIVGANLALTDLVYRFALQRGISELRVASSSAVYPAEWPVLDDDRPLDLNLWPHEGEAGYAWSKRWGEIAAEIWRRRSGINTVSFRLTNPYGPFDSLDEGDAHVATAFVIRALNDAEDFEIRGDPSAERDFVFAGDVAAAFIESHDAARRHRCGELRRRARPRGSTTWRGSRCRPRAGSVRCAPTRRRQAAIPA